MAVVNTRRILLGTLAGGVVWNVWSVALNMAVLAPRYTTAQQAGAFLKQPRYPFFVGQWVVVLFILAYVVARLYASSRATLGPGPKTALRVGVLVGFAAGFPMSFAMAAWAPFGRIFPLMWMLELWVGAILATLTAGWLYRD